MGGHYSTKGGLVVCTAVAVGGVAVANAVVMRSFLLIRSSPADTGAAAMPPSDGRGLRNVEGFRAFPLPLIFRTGIRVGIVSIDGKGILLFSYAWWCTELRAAG